MKPGWTLYLCFGRSGGFFVHRSENAYGINLGVVSFGVLRFDIERTLAELLKQEAEARANVRALRHALAAADE